MPSCFPRVASRVARPFFISALFLCLLTSAVHAAPLSKTLTTELTTLTQALQEPTADLLATAIARHDLLTTLITTHPAAVLRVALPAAVRATLPAAVQAYVEQHVERTGELDVRYEDGATSARLRYVLLVGDEELSLHFVTTPPTSLQTGAQIRVWGVQVDNALALTSARTSVEILADSLPAAGTPTDSLQTMVSAQTTPSRELRTLVMRVNFQDYPTVQPHSLALVQSVLAQTNLFFLENSQNQVSLSGDVVGYYTLPLNSSPCNTSQMATLAKQAATNAGVNVAAYTNYVYLFSTGSCGWRGYASIGGNQAWLNGIDYSLLAHEMGHNLGLHHSHQLNCGTSTFTAPCTTVDYGDYLDVMGHSFGHYNAFQKERLNWLPGLITTVQTSGTYLLDPYETPAETTTNPTPKALKILKTPGTWYYLEYRQPIGFDAFVQSNPNVLHGIVVHIGSGLDSSLLTMTPETQTLGSALEVGHTFTDPTTGMTITLLEANTTGAAVSVSFPQTACLPAPSTVTVTATQTQGVSAGTTVPYTVSVTNNDSAACPAAALTWQATLPTSSWTATFATPTLTLAAGARATTTLQVTSPQSALMGFYTVGAQTTAHPPQTATRAATAVQPSTSAIYQVTSGLTVAVTTAQPSYTLRQQVAIQASVLQAGAPVAGATVSFTLTRPNGTVLTKTNLHSSKQGVAKFTVTLNGQNDTVGLYQVAAHVTTTAGSWDAATSFSVR